MQLLVNFNPRKISKAKKFVKMSLPVQNSITSLSTGGKFKKIFKRSSFQPLFLKDNVNITENKVSNFNIYFYSIYFLHFNLKVKMSQFHFYERS